MACVSSMSPWGVDVPWALMYSTSLGSRFASSTAIRTTGEHDRGSAPPNPLERLAERMGARRAGARIAVARTAKVQRDRHLTGGEVRDDGRDEVGADLGGAPLVQRDRVLVEVLDPPE